MPKRPAERIVVTVELYQGSVRIVTAYHDTTGLCGLQRHSLPIPPERREWKDRLSDLIDLDDEVVRRVRLWVNQGRLF